MCSLMAVEIGFSANETSKIIERLGREPALCHLDFLKDLDFENINIKTELDDEDNESINFLFANLGKSDCATTLELLESFRKNMELSRKKYEDYYKSHAKLYVMFGIFGGLAVTLVLI